MHVAIINYVYSPEAPESDPLFGMPTSLHWAEAVAAGGVRVTLLQRWRRDLRFERNGVHYVCVAEAGDARLRLRTIPRRLHRVAAELQPDLVHLDGMIFPLQTWALRRTLPRTTALMLQHHAGDPPRISGIRSALFTLATNWGLAEADGFLFTAVEMADSWRQAGIIRKHQRVYAVPEASTTLRSPADAPRLPGDPALLWVGRLHPIKDPLTVLDGVALARPQLPNLHLTMVFGSTELLPQVQARIEQDDLRGAVTLRGRLPHAELPALYAGADLFVLGSRREAAGFALIEALACGVTPVVSDIAPFRAVTGEHAGLHWPVGSAAGCAAALIAAAQRDRAASRRSALDRFEHALSWPVVGQQALAAYRDLWEHVCGSH